MTDTDRTQSVWFEGSKTQKFSWNNIDGSNQSFCKSKQTTSPTLLED